MSTYSLTLRNDKGSVLTIEEMDNNFKYLDSKPSGGGGTVSITAVPGNYTVKPGDYKIIIDTNENQDPATVRIPNASDVGNGVSYKIFNVDSSGDYEVTITTEGNVDVVTIKNSESIEITSYNGQWFKV
jgi:hypothetical protein